MTASRGFQLVARVPDELLLPLERVLHRSEHPPDEQQRARGEHRPGRGGDPHDGRERPPGALQIAPRIDDHHQAAVLGVGEQIELTADAAAGAARTQRAPGELSHLLVGVQVGAAGRPALHAAVVVDAHEVVVGQMGQRDVPRLAGIAAAALGRGRRILRRSPGLNAHQRLQRAVHLRLQAGQIGQIQRKDDARRHEQQRAADQQRQPPLKLSDHRVSSSA